MTVRQPQAFVHAPARHFELAPYLREPSPMLRFLAFYFTVTGAFALVAALLALTFKLTGSASLPWNAGVISLYGLDAAGLVFTGLQLRGRNQAAWHCGWVSCIALLLSLAFGQGLMTQGIFAVVSLGLLYSVRREFE
jgi:hypothetical protein